MIYAVQNYENKNQSMKKSCVPAKLKASISVTSPYRLKLTLQMQRLENKRLVLVVNQLHTELQKSSVEISKDIHTDFIKIFSDNLDKQNIPPFMKLFKKILEFIQNWYSISSNNYSLCPQSCCQITFCL